MAQSEGLAETLESLALLCTHLSGLLVSLNIHLSEWAHQDLAGRLQGLGLLRSPGRVGTEKVWKGKWRHWGKDG